MYGLLLEAICSIIKEKHGLERWEEISRKAGIDTISFSTHTVYREDFIPSIARAAAIVLGMEADDIMYEFGMGFVCFVSQFGYDNILKVLGRNMRDFLNGLDNLHEYLRFSYPKMNAPSFFVENESKSGLTLHYRTRRKGFIHYVMGQIKQVGLLFYNTDVKILVMGETQHPTDNTWQITFRLEFDNSAYRDSSGVIEDGIVDSIPLRAELLFDLFPFHVVFGRDMEVRSVGSALSAVIPGAVGECLTDIFFQSRPLTKLCWEEVLAHTNNVFELVTRREMKSGSPNRSKNKKSSVGSCSGIMCTDVDEGGNRLHLKGQMVFMSEWDSIMFLGTPIMQNLDDMFNAGLYINDLSMHDCSRDLVLAGTQQSAELKLALDQEQQKSRLLSESMKKLDEEIRLTDEFVYQMIPKPVADRLRAGESSVNTCQTFDSVTILFSDVVGFTTICSRITPMEVVSMLNAMYTAFDKLSEKHNVYKVETIGDAYMAVAGAPTVTKDHALSMCDMALDMLLAMPHLKDPSSQDNMRIRIGIHTGSTVAGVVGLKMPRYCLFGDTVNTASRMETNGEAMKTHISETTRQMLINKPYQVQERGEIEIKGKGSMKTYWLVDRSGISVQEIKEEREKREKDQHNINQEQQSLNGEDYQAPNALPTHRHIYSPVSFDDLANDPAQRPSPVGSARSSSGHTFGPLQKKLSRPYPERRVSNPCPERGISSECLERKACSACQEGKISSPQKIPCLCGDKLVSSLHENGMTCCSERTESAFTTVMTPRRRATISESGVASSMAQCRQGSSAASSPVTSALTQNTSAMAKPTQAVPPTRCDSPSLPSVNEGRPPDQYINSMHNHLDNNTDQHNPQDTPFSTHSNMHQHPNNSNNNDMCKQPLHPMSTSDSGNNAVHPVQDVVNDSAGSSLTDGCLNPAKNGRNGRAPRPDCPVPNYGRHPQKSRSKACILL